MDLINHIGWINSDYFERPASAMLTALGKFVEHPKTYKEERGRDSIKLHWPNSKSNTF
jgi:hypothetical protein